MRAWRRGARWPRDRARKSSARCIELLAPQTQLERLTLDHTDHANRRRATPAEKKEQTCQRT